MAKGPIPKDPAMRHGHDMGAQDSRTGIEKLPASTCRKVPDANPHWHPYAVGWYNSLKLSGQSASYEPSDWATALVAAQLMDELLQGGFASPGLLAEWNDMASRLCTTLGDRRRARIQLIRAGETDPDDAAADAEVRKMQRKLKAVPGG
jgi:hypothetical protein